MRNITYVIALGVMNMPSSWKLPNWITIKFFHEAELSQKIDCCSQMKKSHIRYYQQSSFFCCYICIPTPLQFFATDLFMPHITIHTWLSGSGDAQISLRHFRFRSAMASSTKEDGVSDAQPEKYSKKTKNQGEFEPIQTWRMFHGAQRVFSGK